MDPSRNQQSTSKSVGTSNWLIDDFSHQHRLAEDLATLQSGSERLPPSPETTGGPNRRKDKGPEIRHTDPALADDRRPPPHMDPRLPNNQNRPPQLLAYNTVPPPAGPTRQELAEARKAKEMCDFEEAEFHL